MSTFGDFMIGQTVEKNQELDRLRKSNRELLEALRRCLIELEFHSPGHSAAEIAIAKTAIDKAEGR